MKIGPASYLAPTKKDNRSGGTLKDREVWAEYCSGKEKRQPSPLLTHVREKISEGGIPKPLRAPLNQRLVSND
jgi:hypothetical protein